jgi:hypothetical protein
VSTTVYFFFRGKPVQVVWEGEYPREGEFVDWQMSGGIPQSRYRVMAVSWAIGVGNSVTFMLEAA